MFGGGQGQTTRIRHTFITQSGNDRPQHIQIMKPNSMLFPQQRPAMLQTSACIEQLPNGPGLRVKENIGNALRLKFPAGRFYVTITKHRAKFGIIHSLSSF